MGKSQRDKGCAGEREFCFVWCELTGEELQRRLGQERDGGADVHSELANLAFQIKRTERLALHAALRQAIADCPDGMLAAVASRRNRDGWHVTMPLNDFAQLVREAINGS